jgi:fibronectin type 3 domain-containing protein
MLGNLNRQIHGFPKTTLISSGLRKYLLLSLTTLLGYFLIASCGSTPKPEGRDFLSESSKYGREEGGRGSVFVSPQAQQKIYRKVAVMPFRAPVELVGASIADMVGTEILKTYKYQLIERSQMEQVLEEQSLGLKGVSQSTLAMKVGKILGVEGVIIGTVPEYGMRAVGALKLPAVDVNIRMIDVETGSIIWSITDSAICQEPISLSAFARHLIGSMIHRLKQEWVRTGDTVAISLPPPQITSSRGEIQKAIIEILPYSSQTYSSYRLLRSRSEKGPFTQVAIEKNEGKRNIVFKDEGLLDATTYYYKVDAVSAIGLIGPTSEPFKVTTKGPPSPVFEFEAVSDQLRKVFLVWTPVNKPDIKGYSIYRANQRNGPYKEIAFVKGKDAKHYLDKGEKSSWGDEGHLKDNTEYFYKIQSVNVVDFHSPDSPIISAVTKGPPSPVVKLQAKNRQARKVPLTWTPVNEEEVKGYSIYRANQRNGPYKEIAFVKGKDAKHYLDKGEKSSWGNEGHLKDNTEYFYKIQSVNVVDVHSPDSPIISAVTKPIPVPVTGLKANQLEVKQISLNWQPNPETDIKEYDIFRGKSQQSIKKNIKNVPGTVFSYTDKELEDGQKYFYRVRAIDKDNLVGKFSDPVRSMTKPLPSKPKGLTIDFDNGQIKLSWHKNPEMDIAHYQVFKKAFFSWEKVGETIDPIFFYKDELKEGKTLVFMVKAADTSKMVSEPSEEISYLVPK